MHALRTVKLWGRIPIWVGLVVALALGGVALAQWIDTITGAISFSTSSNTDDVYMPVPLMLVSADSAPGCAITKTVSDQFDLSMAGTGMAPGVICGAKVTIADSSPANLHTVYAQPAQLELPEGIVLLRQSCGIAIVPGSPGVVYELVFQGTDALTPGLPVTFQSHTVFGLTAPTCP